MYNKLFIIHSHFSPTNESAQDKLKRSSSETETVKFVLNFLVHKKMHQEQYFAVNYIA